MATGPPCSPPSRAGGGATIVGSGATGARRPSKAASFSARLGSDTPPSGGRITSTFDERAATWDDDPARRARARTAAEHLRAELDLHQATRLLEYGAGTGLLAEQLRPDVGPVTLAEPSDGMREVLQRKVADDVLPDARVLDLDLARDPVPDATFDVVVTLMVLHHIPDLGPVLTGFATLLRDGGQLAIIDLDAEDGSFHDDGFDGHDGFDHGWLSERLIAAGFTTPRFAPCGTTQKHGRDYGLFLATCRVEPGDQAR